MSSWWLQSPFNWHLNKKKPRRVAENVLFWHLGWYLEKWSRVFLHPCPCPHAQPPFYRSNQSIIDDFPKSFPASSGPWTKDRQDLGSTGKVLVRTLLVSHFSELSWGSPTVRVWLSLPLQEMPPVPPLLSGSDGLLPPRNHLFFWGKKKKINRMIKLVIFCSGRTFLAFPF